MMTHEPNEKASHKETSDFLCVLKSHFEQRKEKNPRYSLRAFASHLNESPSYLSKIFLQKRNLTPQKIYQYGERLGFHQGEIDQFVKQAINRKRQSPTNA